MAVSTVAVTMKGKPVTLIGTEVRVGQSAPDCTLIANDLSEVKLSSFKGKKVLISVVPSLDTGICDIQTRKFNEEATKLGSNVVIVTVSVDLPFAQKRWCGQANATNIKVLSDYRDRTFGEAYGVLIKELKILTRSIFIVDEKGTLRYKQIVNEITQEPNYKEALDALKNI